MLFYDIRKLDSTAVVVNGVLDAEDPIWEPGDPMPSGAIRVTGRLSATGSGQLYWHGHIAGSAVLPCSRCLTETSVAVEDDAHIIFAETDGEASDDPDVYTFGSRDKEIDLRPTVRELWLINAPGFALCREDCKGLCATCGADLNAAPCQCPPTGDSPWDALRKLNSTSST